MRNLIIFITSSLITLSALGCSDEPSSNGSGGSGGSGGGSGGSGNSGITLKDFAAAVEDTTCSGATECHQYESEADCKASNSYYVAQVKADVNAGKIKYHPEKAQACLDAYGKLQTCSYSEFFESLSSQAEACNSVFEGTVADGEECFDSKQCVSSNCLIFDNCTGACCPGNCVAAPEVKSAALDEPCSFEVQCVDGTYCRFDDMGMPTTCTAQVEEGKACDSDSSCKAPSFCALDLRTQKGTCKVPAAHGADCDTHLFAPCDALDDFCAADTQKCTTKKLPGDPCDGATPCVDYASCDFQENKCVKRALKGDACEVDSFPFCQGNLSCEGGTCQFEKETVCP